MAKKSQRSTSDPQLSTFKSRMLIERVYVPPTLPRRPDEGHKGLFGRVLVVGGNQEMFGAAVLAATAALRAGSGLVQIAVPERVLPFAICITPELIGLALSQKSEKSFHAATEVADCLVIGPGMGRSTLSRKRLLRVIEQGKPTVIDADGLNILSQQVKLPKKLAHALLTPHPGEMLRLCKRLGVKQIPTDDRGRLALATNAARAFGTTILLKGHRSIITDGRRAYVNRTGNSALSKAGSGDVLSGVIGSLIGQGMNVFDAACAGAWIHGKAGELAGERRGSRSALARDVIDAIGDAICTYPNR